MGEMRNANKILARKHKVERLLGRARRIWEDNIRMDLQEKKLEVMAWILLAHGKVYWRALVNSVMKLLVP